jgi:hypothetical protein
MVSKLAVFLSLLSKCGSLSQLPVTAPVSAMRRIEWRFLNQLLIAALLVLVTGLK